MAMPLRYSDILAGILEKKHSKCNCPSEYFKTSLKSHNTEPNRGCCQFGPNCEFLSCDKNQPPEPVICEYDEAKCTCFTKCTCGPQIEPQIQNFLPEPQLNNTALKDQNCICVNCYCESEETLLKDVYRPTTDCNKSICICNTCFCQRDKSEYKLLPTNFRNAIKKEALMSDERIKQECDEIKKLLTEHEESKKKDLEEPNLGDPKIQTSNDRPPKKKEIQKVSIFEDSSQIQPDYVKDPFFKNSSLPQETPELTESSPAKYVQKNDETKDVINTNTGKIKTVPKKEKVKWKQPHNIKTISPKSATSKYTLYSCGCRMPTKKPLRVRYYYSGGTENYGVKLGHKMCVPPLKACPVPKNMGWLWNLEDPSKGIRERKGWPPGFIGKNIKNMMKVLKQLGEDTTGGKDQGEEEKVGRKPWKGVNRPAFEEEEPGEEPPLLHIQKKGRTYNITFCPKSSDKDIGPIPIPFSITDKRKDTDSESSESTLEFELHSPKPRLKPRPYLNPVQEEEVVNPVTPEIKEEPGEVIVQPSSTGNKTFKKKANKRKSKSIEDNKNLEEDLQTQIQNIP